MARNIPDAKLAELDQYLELECKNYQIPGLSAVIVDAQEILWMKACGMPILNLAYPQQSIRAIAFVRLQNCSLPQC